jgi:hypothetical protein
MMPDARSKQPLSERELQVFRAHGEWSSRFIAYSLIVCFVSMGRALTIFEYTGTDERARTPALVLLATMILINVVWRAASAVTSRIELMLIDRSDDRR